MTWNPDLLLENFRSLVGMTDVSFCGISCRSG
jgi:hypothetical protein